MKNALTPTLLALGLAALMALSLALGRYPVTPADLARLAASLLGGDGGAADPGLTTVYNVVINIRLPRVLAAVLIGAALAASGAAFQAMFVNPLVSPGLLGVLAGASFGAALGMTLGQSWPVVQLCAVGCGLLAVAAAVGLAALYRGERLLMLILGGVVSSAMFTALLTLVKYVADPYDQLPAIVHWLMGGLSLADGPTVWAMAGPLAAAVLLLALLAGRLNVLSMGDEEARALGVNVGRLRLALIVAATVAGALTVALAGVIGWVGLVIPHIARMVVGPDNRRLMPAAILMGGAYLLLVDDLARLLLATETPLGILTALVGIPFFAAALGQARRGWQ